jgi:cytochrome P450 PksS
MPQPAIPDLASPQFQADPHPFYARLRAEAPVLPVVLPDQRQAWLVARYEDVATLLKDDRFAKDPRTAVAPGQRPKRPWVPPGFAPLARNMLDLDDPDHARLRLLVHKAFTPRVVAGLHDRIQTLADELLDAPLRAGRLELVADYALPLPATVIAELLGVPAADRDRFHRWSRRMVAVTSTQDALRAAPAIWAFMRYLRRLFAQRRIHPQDDLLSGLVQAEEAGDRLDRDELVAMGVLLLTAGHETTVNLIASGTLALLQHPDQMERLRTEPDLLKPAIEELLRFASPVALATERYARADVELAGTVIPRGALVLGVLASANRDERQFAAPDQLDLGRAPNRHLAFGLGPHFCLGAPLARLEAQLALSTLLRRAPDLHLAVEPGALRWRRGLFLRGLEALPLAS